MSDIADAAKKKKYGATPTPTATPESKETVGKTKEGVATGNLTSGNSSPTELQRQSGNVKAAKERSEGAYRGGDTNKGSETGITQREGESLPDYLARRKREKAQGAGAQAKALAKE